MTNGLQLEKIEIPEGVEYIGEHVFDGTFVKEITIPETVETVGGKFMELSTEKLVVYGEDTNFEEWPVDSRWKKEDIKTKVFCYKGSKAESFFKDLGCAIEYLK